MRILSVVGARPQFVKLAPMSRALDGHGEHVIVHTGQHYDDLMSDTFFRDLRIPQPDLNLEIGSGAHGVQTGAMLSGLEAAFERYSPDWVLVYGDTNSTLAAAIAAVKLHLPVAHLEAGLRSFNRRMPEEHNRVLTDHAADLLLAPTTVAMRHLANEGLAARAVLVGDVMTDVLISVRDEVLSARPPLPPTFDERPYRIATIHRPDNTDDPERLASIVSALAALDLPVVLVAHPRLTAAAERYGIRLAQGGIRVAEPLPYPRLVAAVMGSAGVITDSGGLQKEAYLLGVPATTLRPETEWVETVESGWNVLANDVDTIADAVMRPAPPPPDGNPYGDGTAARQAVRAMMEYSRG